MFDTKEYHTHNTEYKPYEKLVVEKKAPTDDSIRLYGELLEKAYGSILSKFKCEGNTLNLKGIQVGQFFDAMNPFRMSEVLWMGLELNGKEYDVQIPLPNGFPLNQKEMEECRAIKEDGYKLEEYIVQGISRILFDIFLEDIQRALTVHWRR
jgi:hypothetical protein